MDLRAQLTDLWEQSAAMLAQADADGQRELTEAERAELDELDREFERLKADEILVDRVQARGEVWPPWAAPDGGPRRTPIGGDAGAWAGRTAVGTSSSPPCSRPRPSRPTAAASICGAFFQSAL